MSGGSAAAPLVSKSSDYSLDRGLVLPDFNEPGKRSWPPHELPLGVLLAEQMKIRGYG